MNVHRADVAILMPGNMDYECAVLRYGGLVEALSARSVTSLFAKSLKSYNPGRQAFPNVFDLKNAPDQPIAALGMASVIRDLTMPASDDRRLYDPAMPAKLAHHPATNRFLTDKGNMAAAAPKIHPVTIIVSAGDIAEAAIEIPGQRVILKPVTGQQSKGVKLLLKSKLATISVAPGMYLLQEFINTARGIPELGVIGVHNIRVISIDSQVIGSIARVGGSRKNTLRDDIYGNFIDYDDLPDSMHAIADAVHAVLASQPGHGQNVIAIDMMRGINAAGEQVDVLCEVNRRPRRISPQTILDKTKNLDNKGILHLGRLWDNAEATLLARQAQRVR